MLRRGMLAATVLVALLGCVTDNSTPAEATAEQRVRPIDKARQVLAGPVTVSVLGDSTGDSSFDWVTVWAQRLARDRAVTLHTWNHYATQWMPAEQLSTDGQPVVIWNYSVAGGTAAQVPSLRRAQPERPDLVIYNFGHNNYTADHGPELQALSERVERRWRVDPVPVAISQNPSTGTYAERQRATMRLLRREVGPELGMPVVNVTRAFRLAPGRLRRLLMDTTHPNEAGGRVWARAVDRALRSRR